MMDTENMSSSFLTDCISIAPVTGSDSFLPLPLLTVETLETTAVQKQIWIFVSF